MFKNEIEKAKFADDLLNCLNDKYYSWTEDTNSWRGKVRKCMMVRGYRKIPAKAEKFYTGCSVSWAIQSRRDKGKKYIRWLEI